MRIIARRCIWFVLAISLIADGPLFWDTALWPPQDVFYVHETGQLNPEHLNRNRILFTGFVLIQGVLVFAAMRFAFQ